jgi:hypothetical protein
MSRDLRRYARQTNWRLVAGGILLTFVVGLGLIYSQYGLASAISGLICLLAGLSPLVLIAGALWGIQWYVDRVNAEAEREP